MGSVAALTTVIKTAPASTFPPSSWTEDDTLEPGALTTPLLPRIGTLTLRRKYGHIDGSVRSAQSYAGKFVQITITDEDDVDFTWWGYISPAPTDVVFGDHTDAEGTTVHTGDQMFTAYDVAFFLDDRKVATTLTDSGSISRVVPLNGYDRGDGLELVGNHVLDTDHKVESTPGSGDTWNAHTALLYWRQLVEDELGITLTLSLPSGFDTALQQIETVWDWTNNSYLQALMTIVSPNRGYICWLDGTTLHVSSTVASAIQNAGSTTVVPANPSTTTFSAAVSALSSNPTIRQLGTVHYDKVLVRGAPIRITMTMAFAKNTLDKAWESADETTFDSASAEDLRKAELRDVYRRFKLPDAWDFNDDVPQILIPAATNTGGLDWTTAQSAYFNDWLLERRTILPDGASYKIEDIQAWIYDGTSKYYRIDDNTQQVHASLSVLDDMPGFRLTPRDPATYGNNHYGGSDATATWDWEDLYVTVTLQTNDHLRYEATAIASEPGPLERIKVIDVSELQLWAIAKGTVTDAFNTTKTEQAANAILRDDSAALENLAYIAKAWYGQRRSAITGGFQAGVLFTRLGDLISSANYGGNQNSVGTVISEIVYNLEGDQKTTWKTDLLEPDFTKWFSDGQGAPAGRRRAQGAVNVPATPAGGGGAVAVKITGQASPANDNWYLGDVYGNGIAENYDGGGGGGAKSSTETGVEIYVPESQEDLNATDITNKYLHAQKVGDHYEVIGAPLFL